MRRARQIWLAVVVLAAQSCAPATTTAVAPGLPPVDPATQMAALESRIFDLVQAERRRIDPQAKILVLDGELANAAREHSSDMAEKNYFADRGPDGVSAADLIMNADAKFQGLLGENLAAEHIAVGYTVDVDTLARRFVDTWLASPRHRENLAFAAYDRSGVGAAVKGDTIYVTQLFATELGSPPAEAGPARPAKPE